ncbi:serine carboxypeptidase-like 51 [Perilla frutescens var. frutescens]|nr:serine carboxypeptidase-like 51 [Perilla frutescens var. frutescens]
MKEREREIKWTNMARDDGGGEVDRRLRGALLLHAVELQCKKKLQGTKMYTANHQELGSSTTDCKRIDQGRKLAAVEGAEEEVEKEATKECLERERINKFGPGSSGVGIGNFEEIGPLDTYLKPRNSTWLTKADLLFVDNQVGTGYNFVEDLKLLVKTYNEAAADLTTLLIEIFNRNETLQNSPLYIVAESYGGKYVVTLGLSALKAIQAGKLKLKLRGIALGDTWISPEDFVEREDAQRIHRTIVDCFERASLPNLSDEERRKNLHFVVVGGGPTGVEFAARFHDYVNEDLVKLYPKVKEAVKITLLETTDHILNM